MNTDQIAAEAAIEVGQKACVNYAYYPGIAESIIKSAIEKATEEKQQILDKYTVAMDAIYNHNEAARAAVVQHFGTIHAKGALRESRAAHASEIDPVSGYRYDQEIPKPICEMQQIEPAHASEPMRLLDYWYHRGSVSREAYLEIKHALKQRPAHASEPRLTVAEQIKRMEQQSADTKRE